MTKKLDNYHRCATEFWFTFIFTGVMSFSSLQKAQNHKNCKKAYKSTNYPHNQTSPVLLPGWRAVTDSRSEICTNVTQ